MTKHRYTYKHYKPFAQEGGFNDASRTKDFEGGDISFAILQPNPPYDDDSMLVRWNSKDRRWITNFSMVISGGTFPTGETIENLSDGGERAALVLLAYFGHERLAEDFTPEKIGLLSPYDLEHLSRDSPNNLNDFLFKLLKSLDIDESHLVPWLEQNVESISLMPNRFAIKKGFTGLGVIVNSIFALKFDSKSRIQRELGFYSLDMGRFREFTPKVCAKSFTDDGLYGAMVLENVTNGESGSKKAQRLFSYRPKGMVDYVLYMMGVMHSELSKNNSKEDALSVKYIDMQGQPHHLNADDPLRNIGHYNLHFFRDTKPSKESMKMIDYYNSWLKENETCIIHGDIKLDNIVNGHLVDPSTWGRGNELDELAYFLSDITLYKGRGWFDQMVDTYIRHRSSHDSEFRGDLLTQKYSYLFDTRLRLGALQRQLALRDSVMKKRKIEAHLVERLGYHHFLEELTSYSKNPKAY